MNVKKEAFRDASEFARAQVFYGEGAGNRRKLIKTVVASKAHRSPAYAQAFEAALAVQDMAEHVRKAQKERRRRDVFHAVNKNTRNAMSGRYTGVNMAVIALGGAAYYAHRTGYDKKVLDKAKAKIKVFRGHREERKSELIRVKFPTPRQPHDESHNSPA